MTDKARGFDRRSKSIDPTYRRRAMADEARDFDLLPEIHGAEDLLAIAIGMEEEAARRYGDLARRMVAAGHAELAELFLDLEAREREQQAGIVGWAQHQGINVPKLPPAHRRSPATLTEEEVAEAGGDALMTPESALNLAILHEQRAFAFYVRVATEAVDEQVREYAERMASEDINHVARLRLARRRAARRRYAAGISGPTAFDDATLMAGYVEEQNHQAAAQLRAAATGSRAAGWPRIGERLDVLAASSSGASSEAVPEASSVTKIVDAELRRAENVYETLMHTAEQSEDEALVTVAQDYAQTILQRLGQLSELQSTLSRETSRG